MMELATKTATAERRIGNQREVRETMSHLRARILSRSVGWTLAAAFGAAASSLFGQTRPASAPGELPGYQALAPSLEALYLDLHKNPELSLQEEKTAAKLAERMRALGFEVTERVGGFGIVAVLKNGAGPTVMVRTDMDALPIKEATGLPYASATTARSLSGDTVSVMHACGHDIHMSSWIGAATLLANTMARNRWHGTLV